MVCLANLARTHNKPQGHLPARGYAHEKPPDNAPLNTAAIYLCIASHLRASLLKTFIRIPLAILIIWILFIIALQINDPNPHVTDVLKTYIPFL